MIRQRVLYVGIGGSGLDLGIQLDEALRRQICGLDGRSLSRRGGVFAGFQPNQLPNFIQSVYIDFASESLQNVTSRIKGGNAHAANDLIPTIENYRSLAQDLRLECDPESVAWIPPKSEDEPNVKPLNGGAGQFPTVGRAAMFHSIKNQGFDNALGNKLSRAVKELEGSGQLDAYTGQVSALKTIAVYVGFSLSGGTGCGLFLDILYLLTRQLKKDAPNNPCVIIPIVMLPSTFGNDLPPEKARRARLNAAPGLLDIARLMQHHHRPDVERSTDFEIVYPDPTIGRFSMEYLGTAPTIPVVSVIAKGDQMDRDDVMRSVAAAIVSHASSTVVQEAGAGVGITNENSFIENLINDIPDISSSHQLGLGTHPLMPMVASSLTVPSRQIADVLAQRAVADGVSALTSSLEQMSAPTKEQIDEFISHCGLGDMVRPNVFSEETNLNFAVPSGIRTQSDLDQALIKARQRATSATPIIKTKIDDAIARRSVFSPLSALKLMLQANPQLSLVRAISIAQAALNQLETGGTKVAAGVGTQVPGKKNGKKSGTNPLKKVLPQRVTVANAAKAIQVEEAAFKERVREMWWTEWGQRRMSWTASVENGREQFTELQRYLKTLVDSAKANVGADQANLSQRRHSVISFVPTEGRVMSDFFDVLYFRSCDRVREMRAENDRSPEALLMNVCTGSDQPNAWVEFVSLYDNKKDQTSIFESLLTPMRSAMESAMTGDGNRSGTLKDLNSLLREACLPQRSADSEALIGALGDLVPDTLIPAGDHKSARVLISYPGDRNEEIEALITSKVSLGASFAALLGKQSTKLLFTPTGDGDVVTVNINVIGQGLLDQPETREILRLWTSTTDSANSELLSWRQRLGYQTQEQLFSRASRDDVMAQLLRALVYGDLKIIQGQISSPEKLEIGNERTADSSMTRVEFSVPQSEGMSSWPNVLTAYERLVLSLDPEKDMRDKVVKSVMGSPVRMGRVTIPQEVHALWGMRDEQIARIKSDLEKANVFGPLKVRSLRAALDFWESTLPKAFDKPIDTEFVSLQAALANVH